MVSLAMLLYISHGVNGPVGALSATLGPVLLGVAALLTVWSLVVYMKVCPKVFESMLPCHLSCQRLC